MIPEIYESLLAQISDAHLAALKAQEKVAEADANAQVNISKLQYIVARMLFEIRTRTPDVSAGIHAALVAAYPEHANSQPGGDFDFFSSIEGLLRPSPAAPPPPERTPLRIVTRDGERVAD